MTKEDVLFLYNFCEAVILDVEASRSIGAAGSQALARNFLTSTTNVVQGTIDTVNRIGRDLDQDRNLRTSALGIRRGDLADT